MKRKALTAILALLVVAAPALAGPDRADLEKKLFEAYWLENGKRDLDAAREAYFEVADGAGEAIDLRIRAMLGRARIDARSGGREGQGPSHLEGAKAWLKRLPKNYDAKILAALKQEIAETEAIVTKYGASDEVATQIARFVEVLGQGPDSRNGKAAVEDLLLFGDRAVPQVAAALSAKHPRAVAGAARVLVRLNTDLATASLAKAIGNPAMLYRAQAVKELDRATDRHRAIFKQALADPAREVRLAAARALTSAVRGNPGLNPVVVSGLDGSDTEIRRLLLAVPIHWATGSILTTADRLIDDRDPVVRERATQLVRRLNMNDEVTPEDLALVPGLLRITDLNARKFLLSYAVRKGGEIARQALIVTLTDDDPEVRRYSVNYLRGNQVAWSPDFVPALLASAEKTVRTEHASTWSNAAKETLARLDRSERTEQNGKLLVGLLGRLAKEAPEERRALALGYVHKHLAFYPASVQLAAWDVLRRDEDKAQWLTSLGSRLENGVVERAEAALDTNNTNLRVASLMVLSRLQTTVQVKPLLLKLTYDPNAAVRYRALTALAPTLSPEEKRKAVLRALGDDEYSVRLAAMNHLAALTGEDLEGPLIEAVRKDPDRMAYPAMKAVAALGNDETTRRIATAITAELAGRNTNTLASVWRVAGAALTDRMILDGLRHDNLQVRQVAADLAAERHLLEAWPILLELTKSDPHDPFRRSLERIRTYHLGMKEYLDVRDAGGEDLFAKAEALARSEDKEERVGACYAFAVLGGSRSLSRLLGLVGDKDPSVRQAALDALKKLGAAPTGK